MKSVDGAPSRGAVLLLAAVWLAVAALRLGFVWGIHETGDLRLWRFDLSVLDRHGSLYGETPYNDAPLWAGLILGIGRTAQHWGWSFETSVCAFLTLIDAGVAALVWRIVRGRANRTVAACCALLAFANPISVMASSFLGQFDNIAIALLLVALLLSTHGRLDSLSVSGTLGVSLIARHVAWFHPLLLARGPIRRRAWIVAVPYGLFLLSFLPFWRSWRQIWTRVFLYRSSNETYGIEPLRHVSWLPRETATFLFIAVMVFAVWQLRRVEFGRACLLLFLVQLIVIPGVWPHYFVWPIALGAIYPSVGYLVYTLVLTAFYFKSPDVLGLDWPHLPAWWGCWWATIFWLLWEIRALRARPAAPEGPGGARTPSD